jgi:4-amino-4-deoxy-L-arabinose transferase-like glycosyltransferase
MIRRIAPVLLATALLVPSLVWISIDRSIWPWDPAWYGEVSVDLWATLHRGGNWGALMAHAFGAKPPAIAWFGQAFVPLGGIVGGDGVALMLSILVCQGLSILLVYYAVRRLTDPAAAVAAALLLAASPLFVALSHEYFAEPIQTVSTAWLLLILASAWKWRTALTFAQLPGALALGMLSKLSAPLYLAAPAVAAVVLALRARRSLSNDTDARRWLTDPQFVVSALVSGLLVTGALVWYRVNVHAAIAHARASASDNGLYGVSRGFSHQLPQWLGKLRDVTFLPHLWLLVAALAVAAAVVAFREGRRVRWLDPRLVTILASGVSICAVLVSFASQPNQDPRYLLPLIPYVAVIAGIAVAAPRSHAFAFALATLLVVEGTLVTLQSYGYANSSRLVSYPLQSPQRKTELARTLDRIVDLTCTPASADRINAVGVEYPWLNHNTLEMLAAERYASSGRRCYYDALGYAPKDPAAAWRLLTQLKSPYYIGVDFGNAENPLPPSVAKTIVPDDPFNRLSHVIYLRALRSGLYAVLPRSRQTGTIVLAARNG